MAETLGFNLVFYCESPGWRRYRWACLHAHSRRGGRDNRIYILFHINQTEGFACKARLTSRDGFQGIWRRFRGDGGEWMKYSGIGGQAVIEGIMMKNKDDYATAVRRPDGGIEVMKDRYVSMTEKVKFCALPFVRGVFSFVDSMVLGMKTLTFSASFFEDDEDVAEEPGKFEQFLDQMFGEKLEKVIMGAVMAFSVVMAVVIFMIVPLLLANVLRLYIGSESVMAFLEGLIRIAIFIAYIKLVSRMEEIRRTFMYHGAEHKCINCIEHGMELTGENVRKSSKQHKRCGTSFLIFVMLISILLFMVIRVDTLWLRILSRIVLVPVIAGISYELLRLAGRSDNGLSNLVSKPGLWMQNMTTKEPDDSMIEVAIAAVEAVFDWRAYLAENFPETAAGEKSLPQDGASAGEMDGARKETEGVSAEGQDFRQETGEIPGIPARGMES